MELEKEKETQNATPDRTSQVVTPIMLRMLRKFFSFGGILSVQPYTWNIDLDQAAMAPKRQQIIWGVNMGVALLHLAFIYSQSAQIFLSEDSTAHEVIYMVFMSAFYSLAGMVHVTVIMNRKELARYLNHILRFGKILKDKYGRAEYKKPKLIWIVEFFSISAYYYTGTIGYLIQVAALTKPGSPDQLTSLLQDPEGAHWGLKVLCGLFGFYIQTVFLGSAFAILGVAFGGTPCVISMLDELDAETAEMTTGLLRMPDERLKIYRALKVMNLWYNELYGDVVLPLGQWLFVALFVTCFFGAVRLGGIDSVVFAVGACFCLLFAAVIFTLLGEIHTRSSRVRENWMCARGGKVELYRKQVEALTDIRAQVRSVYYLDRGVTLTMLGAAIDQTVAVLVM